MTSSRSHLSLWHRIKWYFLKKTPEWDTCVRIANQYNQWSEEHEAETGRPGLHFTPGQIWTLRKHR